LLRGLTTRRYLGLIGQCPIEGTDGDEPHYQYSRGGAFFIGATVEELKG
jgi:hypothetical protein